MTTVNGLNGTIKAAIEELQNGNALSATASGTDTYTATVGNITAYATGQALIIKFTNANTGTSTLNVNGIGAITLKKSVSTNLAASDIAAGQVFLVVYDGTNFQIIGLGTGGGVDYNIDGGVSDSIYLISQVIDGGVA